ncbi:hypothetical protein D3C75_594520 [compost metagenome]
MSTGFSYSAGCFIHLGVGRDDALHLSSNQIGKLIAALSLLCQTSCAAGNLFGGCGNFLRGSGCLARSIAKLACRFQHFAGSVRCLGNELGDPLHHRIKGRRQFTDFILGYIFCPYTQVALCAFDHQILQPAQRPGDHPHHHNADQYGQHRSSNCSQKGCEQNWSSRLNKLSGWNNACQLQVRFGHRIVDSQNVLPVSILGFLALTVGLALFNKSKLRYLPILFRLGRGHYSPIWRNELNTGAVTEGNALEGFLQKCIFQLKHNDIS